MNPPSLGSEPPPWKTWEAWAHLPRQDGRPVVANAETVSDDPGQWLFAVTDLYKLTYLALTNRCGVCGHKLGNQSHWVSIRETVIQALELTSQIVTEQTGPNLIVTSPTNFVAFLAPEGVFHPACLLAAASLCPFLGSEDYEIVREPKPIEATAQRLENLGSDADLEIFAELTSRKRSGQKWIGEIQRVIVDLQHLGTGGQVVSVDLQTPSRLVPMRRWQPSDGQPVIEDLTDPLPPALVGMDGYESGALFSLFAPQATPRRNDPCFCGENQKYKYCHGAIKVPAAIKADWETRVGGVPLRKAI